MKKTAYAVFGEQTGGKTLADLYFEIRRDAGMPDIQKKKLIGDIQQMTSGMPVSTPLSALMSKGLGGFIGWLISKYFGMGSAGQVLSTLLGTGVGAVAGNRSGKPMFLSNLVW